MRISRKYLGAGVVLATAVIWFVLGVAALRAQNSFHLIYCILYPHRFSDATSVMWEWVPSRVVREIALAELKQRSLYEIERDFQPWGFTIYRVTFGHYDANEIDSKKLKDGPDEMLVRKIAELLHAKGLRATEPVLPHGCSAVHEALIDRNISAAKYFLELDGVVDVPGNPNAQGQLCRLSTEKLAQTFQRSLQ
jgi:hypothetical protein